MPLDKKAVLAVMADKKVLKWGEYRNLLEGKLATLIEKAGHDARRQVENLMPLLWDIPEESLPDALIMSDEMDSIIGMIDWSQENGQMNPEERIEVEDMMKEQSFLSFLELL